MMWHVCPPLSEDWWEEEARSSLPSHNLTHTAPAVSHLPPISLPRFSRSSRQGARFPPGTVCIPAAAPKDRSSAEPWSLSLPFTAALDTMTEWSGAALFIFQLRPGAPPPPPPTPPTPPPHHHPGWQRGKWKEGAAAGGAVLHLAADWAWSSSCVGTAFRMQTIRLQNVGQAGKEACRALSCGRESYQGKFFFFLSLLRLPQRI